MDANIKPKDSLTVGNSVTGGSAENDNSDRTVEQRTAAHADMAHEDEDADEEDIEEEEEQPNYDHLPPLKRPRKKVYKSTLRKRNREKKRRDHFNEGLEQLAGELC